MIPLPALFILFIALALFSGAMLVAFAGYRQKVYAFKQSLIPAQNHKMGGSSLVAKLVFQDIAQSLRYTWYLGWLMQKLQKRYAPILSKAGNPALLVGDEYCLIKLLVSLIGVILMVVIHPSAGLTVPMAWGLFLYLLPDALLKRRGNTQLIEAQLALPEALNTLAFMLNQGMHLREALQTYVGHQSWTPLQLRLYPYVSQGQGMPLFTPLFKQLHLKDLGKAASILDQLQDEPLQLAAALRSQATQLKKILIKKMQEQSSRQFLTASCCFLFLTVPSVGIILFGPILIDSYPAITKVLYIW